MAPATRPPSFPFHGDVALVDRVVMVVGVGDGGRWRPLATVTMVVVNEGGSEEAAGARREGWWWWWLKKKIIVC